MRRSASVHIVQGLDRTGQETAAKWRISDEADAECARGAPRFLRFLAVKQRVLGLHGGDRMHSMGASDAVGMGFGQTQEPDLALIHQPRHGADRVFDWDRRIHPVLVVKVDHIDPKAGQAGLASLHHVFGPAIHAVRLTFTLDLAELRSQHDLVSPPL